MKNTTTKASKTLLNIAEIIRNGGATLNKNGDPVTFASGYQVSKKDCYIIDVKHVKKITQAVISLLKSVNASDFVGLWIDGGKIYIDISERFKSLKKALRIGTARRQISVFDWAKNDCIYIKH